MIPNQPSRIRRLSELIRTILRRLFVPVSKVDVEILRHACRNANDRCAALDARVFALSGAVAKVVSRHVQLEDALVARGVVVRSRPILGLADASQNDGEVAELGGPGDSNPPPDGCPK